MATHRRSTVFCRIPLLLAAFGALALLVPISCSPNSQLIDAVSRGETEKVKALLDAGADVEAKDYDGFNTLTLGRDKCCRIFPRKNGVGNRAKQGIPNLILETSNQRGGAAWLIVPSRVRKALN